MKMKIILFGWLCLLLSFNSLGQDPPQYGIPYSGVPDPRDVNMYQVHIRPYSAAGNLAGVTARLDAIRALGINVIYLMPVYPHGTDPRSSVSPYSIKDFKSVAAEYGTLSDLRALVDGAHARGMAVILDFAVNGTSWDHPWITQHPDWYDQVGGVIQQLGPFPDVAGLDFNNASMRAAIVDAMRYWIFAANIDGYRCDYANKTPLDFWTSTINNLRGITSHKLLMFAEGDRPENFQAGFDLNFGDKWYYDAIKPIRNGSSVSQIQTTTNTEYQFASSTQQVVRYTSNHDVQGNETAINVFGGHDGVIANVVVSAYMRGVPFIASGQEVDFNQTIPWPFQSVKINWNSNPNAAADFARILNFRTSSDAIRRGTMTNYSSNDVCAFTKISGSEKVVVMVNLRSGNANFVIPEAFAGNYQDAFSPTNITLTAGATQSLAGFQYIVLTNTSSCTPTAISPYLSVNGGTWSQTAAATLTAGGSVIFGPQPLTGGSWSWSGPNGFVASVREISLTNVQTNQSGNYVATYTNPSGCMSTETFMLTVNTAPGNLPAPWLTADIGAVAAVGAASYSGNTFTVNASGADVFDFADEFRYVYQPFSGNATVTARVASLSNTNAWAKAGVMIRESLNANASNAAMLLTPSNGFNFQYRNGAGAGSASTGSTPGAIPNWVRITRSGNTLTGFSSINGTSWTQTGTVTISMPANVYIGFFATSHNDGIVTSATFTDVSVTGGVAPGPGYYTIRNRWTNAYLYDAGANVGYGSSVVNDNYKWEKVAVDGTYFLLRNAGTGEFMHIENQTGSVECTSATPAWWSAQWSQENVDATWVRFRNRWQTGNLIHLENPSGAAQYEGVQDSWHSAQWQLSPTTLSITSNQQYAAPTINSEVNRRPQNTDASFSTTPSLKIFPNPATGKVMNITAVVPEDGNTYALKVYDLTGHVISSGKITSGTVAIRVTASGIYLVELSGGETRIKKKVVVQ